MTIAEVRRFDEACRKANAELVPVAVNPIDRIWIDRPAPPLKPVSIHPVALAGEEATAKIARLQAALAEKKVDAVVLTQTDSIAWTFNIRGQDIAHNPVVLAFAILPATGKPTLYVDGRKLSNSVRTALAELVEIREPAEFAGGLAALAFAEAKVLLDPQTAASAIERAIREPGGTIVEGSDPVLLPKARKNPVELAGARRAHVRDGAAMVRFLAWLERTAPSGGLDEVAAADQLAYFRANVARRDGSELVDLSFDTISGAGPNGAIVHYRATPGDVAPAGDRNALPRRFRRPVSRRHHRHHAHGRHRHAHRRDARPLHPRAQGPHRHRHRALSGRDHRRADRRPRPLRPMAGRPRLRSWHRPRHRVVPLGPRRPGAHLQARPRAARSRE